MLVQLSVIFDITKTTNFDSFFPFYRRYPWNLSFRAYLGDDIAKHLLDTLSTTLSSVDSAEKSSKPRNFNLEIRSCARLRNQQL